MQARVDLPRTGLVDAERPLTKEQDAEGQQAAHHSGQGGAQSCAGHAQPGTPDGDAPQRPGGVDEEEVEDGIQHADQHADEAGGQGIAAGPEHGGVHAHCHGEGQGR